MSGYTIVNLEDSPDVTGEHPGELRMLTRQLGSEQVSVTHRTIPPGKGHVMGNRDIGHRHATQEEVYFLVSGRLKAKLDDEVTEIGPGTAVRVAPEVVRSFWNDGGEEAALLIVSNHAVDARQDAEMVQGFWPEHP